MSFCLFAVGHYFFLSVLRFEQRNNGIAKERARKRNIQRDGELAKACFFFLL